jgi:hypothetical protein
VEFPSFQLRPRHLVLATIILASIICTPAIAQDENATAGFGISILSGGYFVWEANDVQKTYGFIPTSGIRIAKIFDNLNEVFLSVEHTNSYGDPYYNHPDFVSSQKSKLKVVPIRCGVRFFESQTGNVRICVGGGLSYYWIEEKTPGFAESAPHNYSGYGFGIDFFAAPELHFGDNQYAAGIEFALGSRKVKMSDNHVYQDLNMSGMSVRGYVSVFLF